ncbi:MAG TPA: hypothetical protein VET26_00310 [Candidatus Sulfotelmatobacter sp.]|nr:hypothetical protein [Candidatus Sulfotelmatobacter sp.]
MSLDSAAEELLHGRIPDEAMRLIEAASAHALHLRVTGSIAIRMHSQKLAPFLDAMGRRRFRDIDFWGYAKEQKPIEQLLQKDGYLADPTIKLAHEWGVKRLIYENPETHIKIDVFMDELVMAHTIHFKGRLDLDYPTIGLADLLLSKLQIHQITENDFIDTIVLLGEHDLGSGDRERIDMPYILELLRNDWGFNYTVLDNLKKTQEALGRYDLPAELADQVRTRIAAIAEQIEAAPKSTRWKLRARVGTRSKWYEDVDEVHR